MKKTQKGFTIIELIVVIAIIAVLSAIIAINTSNSIQKAKMARFEQDAESFEKALVMFYAKYDDYPQELEDTGFSGDAGSGEDEQGDDEGNNTIESCPGEPQLLTDDGTYCLSEFLKTDWNDQNATYFGPNGKYRLATFDKDGDGKIGCGFLFLQYDSGNISNFVYKNILCQDCPDECGTKGTEW
jgi:prepilin-type N-terminal cleavage/methylation domain-containing protein